MKTEEREVYRTITGRLIELGTLAAAERKFLASVRRKYHARPEWTKFASWWVGEFDASGLSDDSVVYRICDDLEARLGIAQGKVAAPDYRDFLADVIEERYKSRYEFCKEVGFDQGYLSRVLAGQADLSMAMLRKLLDALKVSLVLQAEETLLEEASPEEADRALAKVGK